jgi:predicted RecA/RadA family phage recombinase
MITPENHAALERRLQTAIAFQQSVPLREVASELGITTEEADAAAGDPVEVTVSGVWELPKASGQILERAAVWWDNATGHNVVNASGGGLFPIGVAVREAGTNDTTVHLRQSGIPVTAVAGG